MIREAQWPALLSRLPVLALNDAPQRRIVERQMLESRTPPDFLFTSGRPGRYNPAGLFCLYASEDATTAGAEFERYWAGLPVQQVLYFCRVTGSVLDLADPVVRRALGLKRSDLFTPWRGRKRLTLSQRLGVVLGAQTRFIGVRFPSDAAQERGFVGHNIVVFRDAITLPGSVVITDDCGRRLQTWP
jgi:RES domain-containing protein